MSMAMRPQLERPEDLRTASAEFPTSPSHPFYQQLAGLLDRGKFDEFLKQACGRPNGARNGRSRLAPGVYFRLLLAGYFEGIDSSQGIAWRVADSLSLRRFLGIAPDAAPPDHLAISTTGRLIGMETHRKVLRWAWRFIAGSGLTKHKRTEGATPEANAAMRSIVRRGDWDACEAFLKCLAQEWVEDAPAPDRRRQGPVPAISHPFYQRLVDLLEAEKFDAYAEKEANGFASRGNGHARLAPGTYFRLLLVGYFEGIDSERGIAWRVADSLSLRQFLGVPAGQATPDHSRISETRRLIDVETHRRIFFWLLGLLADRGLVKGKRIGVDATSLAASAAMRPIVWRDEVESYQDFLDGLAKESGIETPTRQALVKLGRERKKKTTLAPGVKTRRPRQPNYAAAQPVCPVEAKLARSADEPLAAGPFEPCSMAAPGHSVTLPQFEAHAAPIAAEPRVAPGAALPVDQSAPLTAVPIRLPERNACAESLVSATPAVRAKTRGRKKKTQTATLNLPAPAVALMPATPSQSSTLAAAAHSEQAIRHSGASAGYGSNPAFCKVAPRTAPAADQPAVAHPFETLRSCAAQLAAALPQPQLDACLAADELEPQLAPPPAAPAEACRAVTTSAPVESPELAIRARSLIVAPTLSMSPRAGGLTIRAPRETGWQPPLMEPPQFPAMEIRPGPLPVIQEVRRPKRWIVRIPKSDFRKARAIAAGFLAASLVSFGLWFSATHINFEELFTGARQRIDRAIQARAAFRYEDNFQSGLEGWDGAEHFAETWAFDKEGFMRPGKLALFQPSTGTSDYSVEFLMQIEHRGMGWVVRAADQQNYYALKLVAMNTGPRMTALIERYAVVDGQKETAIRTLLPMTLLRDRPYRIHMEVKGNQFSAAVDGQVVSTWTEARLPTGGVGFFTDRGEQARLYWMRMSNNLDFLGGLCSILAGRDGRTVSRAGGVQARSGGSPSRRPVSVANVAQ